jgi:hypothetical protein
LKEIQTFVISIASRRRTVARASLADVSKLERPPAMDGRRMTALLTPKPGAKGQTKAAPKTAD